MSDEFSIEGRLLRLTKNRIYHEQCIAQIDTEIAALRYAAAGAAASDIGGCTLPPQYGLSVEAGRDFVGAMSDAVSAMQIATAQLQVLHDATQIGDPTLRECVSSSSSDSDGFDDDECR